MSNFSTKPKHNKFEMAANNTMVTNPDAVNYGGRSNFKNG